MGGSSSNEKEIVKIKTVGGVVIFIIGFKSNEKKIFMKVLSKNKKR